MKRREVVFAAEALDDLFFIYRWIREASSQRTAEHYTARLHAYCQAFDLASERGTRRDDLAYGLRIIGFEKRITLLFTVTETRVEFLRVFYGGQDWEAVLRDEEPG